MQSRREAESEQVYVEEDQQVDAGDFEPLVVDASFLSGFEDASEVQRCHDRVDEVPEGVKDYQSQSSPEERRAGTAASELLVLHKVRKKADKDAVLQNRVEKHHQERSVGRSI